MRRFVKTNVPAEGYQEVRRVGDKYVVHFDPVDNGDGSVTCYECMTDSEPELNALRADLALWKEYITARQLATAKKVKTDSLMEYDSSAAVNSFELLNNGVKVTDYWLDRDLRTSLEGDVRACKENGHSTYNFDIREMGITLPLDCTKFLAALNTLREYAYTAYNVTSQHMAAINALTTVADVEGHDYTSGYPTKLSFDVTDLM